MMIDAPKKEFLPALKALWQEAFGDSETFLEAFEKTAFSTTRCRCVTVDGTIAAALYWFDCSYHGARIAYLYAIATAKAHRGRGLCRALMENTHLHLKKLGYTGAILVPGDKTLFDFYEKLGYRLCACIDKICCTASTERAEIRQIDTAEYAALRRKYLPAGGVIQENENLAFLQTQVSFYTGNGFLLAARGEEDTLYGAELLGSPKTAPAVLQALGYAKGNFRTPGAVYPFAMYYPLEENRFAPPSYFGLAFD